MKIFVQQLGGKPKPLTIDVDLQATLSELRTLIRVSADIDANTSLVLVLQETLLEEGMNATTLEDCGIEDGTTLSMLKQPKLFVLTASQDKTAKIWDASTGDCKQTFSHADEVQSAVFSSAVCRST